MAPDNPGETPGDSHVYTATTDNEYNKQYADTRRQQRPYVGYKTRGNHTTITCDLIHIPFTLTTPAREALENTLEPYAKQAESARDNYDVYPDWAVGETYIYITKVAMDDADELSQAISEIVHDPANWEPTPTINDTFTHEIELQAHDNTDNLWWNTPDFLP